MQLDNRRTGHRWLPEPPVPPPRCWRPKRREVSIAARDVTFEHAVEVSSQDRTEWDPAQQLPTARRRGVVTGIRHVAGDGLGEGRVAEIISQHLRYNFEFVTGGCWNEEPSNAGCDCRVRLPSD